MVPIKKFIILLAQVTISVQVLPPSALPISKKDIVDEAASEIEISLSPEDFKNLPTSEVDLRLLGINVHPDPTMGDMMEGDIAILNGQNGLRRRKFRDPQGRNIARNSIRQPYRRWPKNEIPYMLSSQYGSYSRQIIAKAMNEYHSKTCIRFVARDPQKHRDYIFIHPDDGCYSLVGRVGGRQPLSLDSGCIQVGTIVHELMHAVGFFHEQSRYDRDQFIDIIWQNVLRGADDQFERYSHHLIDQLNEPYDYGSIMHYGPFAFSSNGKRTIVPRRQGSNKMGQRNSFSDTDVRKINKLYQCGLQTTAGSSSGAGGRGATSAFVENPTSTTQESSFTTTSTDIDAERGTTDGRCEDFNWRCLFWSLPIIGYCEQYPEVRHKLCPFSCGICHDCSDRPVCATLDDPCSQPLMSHWLCRKTCGKCQSITAGYKIIEEKPFQAFDIEE